MIRKRIYGLCILLLMTIPASVFGMEGPDSNGPLSIDTTIYRSVEVPPGIPYDVNKYIIQNLKLSKEAMANGVLGKISIDFIVEQDGSLSYIEVNKGKESGTSLEEDIKQVICTMPKFTPGQQNGKAVRCYFSLPLYIHLQ